MEEEAKKESIKDLKLEHAQQIQVYAIIDKEDPSWQTLIYDLINSEQLDPWNVDITILCKKYLQKIEELQKENFFVSSKVLLAASLLLRIKSEILLNKYIREIDNVLFNKEEKIDKIIEKIEINEDEIPILSPKTPMPRFKKVTLQELINALDVAIKTEGRRIQKEIEKKQAERLSYVDIPKFRRVNIKDRIRQFYAKILSAFKGKRGEIKIPYSHFTGNSKEEKLACFLPMLHLSNTNRLWLEQSGHYEEIWIYLYNEFKKNFPDHDKDLKEGKEEDIGIEELRQEVEEMRSDFDSVIDDVEKSREGVEEINKDFENPIGDLIDLEIETNS
jgi:segregation and condensation protein A